MTKGKEEAAARWWEGGLKSNLIDSRDTHRISQNLQNSVAAQLLPLTSFAYSSLSQVLIPKAFSNKLTECK